MIGRRRKRREGWSRYTSLHRFLAPGLAASLRSTATSNGRSTTCADGGKSAPSSLPATFAGFAVLSHRVRGAAHAIADALRDARGATHGARPRDHAITEVAGAR